MLGNIAIIAYFSLKFTSGGQPSHAYKRIRPAEQINTSTLRQMLQGRLHHTFCAKTLFTLKTHIQTYSMLNVDKVQNNVS